ncbi:putative DNA polymerase [Frankliniella fusca]|uniref:DNA-directed DNA polymerase n=1 Tax=Frankliniella fusca TaxID=407009 RepID=A0AAE1HRC8_9NEOP|nr:putative DNA polymerase [Frankliniella fusca]
MESLIKEILMEWERGAFYTDEYLATAYTEMLLAPLKASDEDRRDPRLIPFLLVGLYLAYRRQHRDDRQALLTYRMALAMVGGSVDELPLTPPQEEPQPGPSRPPSPQPGPSRAPSPQPGPSRPPSPQPGPSKRRREEVELKPTLEVLQTRERQLRRFNTVFREEVMQISGLGDGLPSEEVLVGLFDSALQRQRDAVGAKDDDRVILEIENAENADNPLWLSLRRADQLSGQVLLDKLGRILNSNQAFMAHGQFKLSYIHIPTPEAGGRKKNRVANETTEAWLERKLDAKQIFAPENEQGHMCLTRSVAVVKARGKMTYNAKAFDAVFALQEVIERKLKNELILQGAKILCMKVGNWKFIDSLMFLPMPLSAMPRSFGLHELKNWYMPFLANKPEFYTYEGPLLDKEFYCFSDKKSKAATDFSKWYEKMVASGYVFNFRRELIEYCISDVTILRQACTAFRKLFEEKAGFDPMFNCITQSAACMAAFRRNFLPKETVGIVPQGGCGYHGRGKQSEIALKWLDYESHKLGKVIKTVLADREVSVMERKVDGYVELPHPDDDNDNCYENTVRLTALFRRNGFTVVEKRECEFNLELKNDPDTMGFFENHLNTRVTPLNLRDALMGGRTSALRWYHKADLDKGEKIKMVDVVSEYSNANLRAKYPVGHPEIFLAGDPKMTPVEEWNGAVKCTVVPPRDLYLPVLPYKANGRLMFPLCRTCVEMQNQEICTHADPKHRQLCSVWCAPEIHLAMEKGYKIETVHEVYQYPRTMEWNGETGREGLLSAYVRCFMALKAPASGWPADCTSDEAKQKYMDDVKKYDGITIDPAKVEKIRPSDSSIEEDYGPGSFITEFVFGRPKNYAFKVALGGDVKQIKVCIKVRGINISASCDQLVTFEQLKAMVMGEQKKTAVFITRMIAQLPTWQIVTRPGTKKWQAVNSKRRRVDAERTVPHGYNAWKMEDEEDQEILEALDVLMNV